MHFICSVNSKVVSALDAVTGKIEQGGDFRTFNNNWKPFTYTSEEIADEVGQSKGLCAWHLVEGKRIKDGTGLIQAGLIIIDIDNQADGKDVNGNKIQKQELSWEEAKELDICKKYLERMSKSNDQILRLAEIIAKEEEKAVDMNDIYGQIEG